MGITICIIEDDLVSQFATRYTITQVNPECRTLVYNNAEEGLEGLLSYYNENGTFPELMLLDLALPGLSGWEFLDEYMELTDETPTSTIYVLSSFTNSKDRERAKGHNLVSGYYDKPLSRSVAREIIPLKG